MFKIFAHRGASAEAPDNSVDAFNLAIGQGADLIETDVRLSADGILVLEHDDFIAGLEVRYTPYETLRQQKPTLVTLTSTLKHFGTRCPFCFEVKAPGIEHALIYMVRDLLDADMWQRTEFTSFHLPSAIACRRLVPRTTVGWLTPDWSETSIQRAKRAGLSQICPPAQAILEKPDLLTQAAQLGLSVRAWLIESPELVPELAHLGVYGGTVNFPKAARDQLGSSPADGSYSHR